MVSGILDKRFIKEKRKDIYEKWKNGLTEIEIKERISRGEVNKNQNSPSRTLWQIIRANLFTSFNVVNIVLAIVVIFAGSPKNAVFAVVILTNTLIGVVQEVRAKKTIEQLSVLNSTTVKVKRNGKEEEVAVEDIVKDDTIILKTGIQIVADARVLEGNQLEVDESLLTGESDPILKTAGSKLLSGSFIVAGEGYAKVTNVGAETYAAKLANEAKKFKVINSELQKAINKIFKVIMWFAFPIGILLITTQLLFANTTWNDAIIGAVSGIVGMIPEGLILLTSATFIVSIIRLSKWNTLVQELPATEVLARVDVLCLDKTGTITEGKLELVDIKILDESFKDYEVQRLLAGIVHSFSSTNPTQNAIIEKFNKNPNLTVINKIPFSSARKWTGVEFDEYGSFMLGAPEVILNDQYSEIKDIVEEEAKKGRRVLLLSKLQGNLCEDSYKKIETIALVLIEDIIREEAPKALQYFGDEGVNVKIVSGDNPVTVSAVAKRAGVYGADNYIDARELPTDITELSKVLENNTVFGRVTPHQKKDIVKALQSRGHTVGMTGDGVNDVLALKEADCGIAMASGSDATKAVAQLVLLDSNFAALPEVVAEGRKLINNLERVAELFLTKTVYSILLSLIFGLILLPFPFTPIQLSLIGSIAIGIPSFFLALGPNRELVNNGFLRRVLRVSIPNGVVIGIGTMSMFIIGYFHRLSIEQCRTLSVMVLGGISIVVLAKVAKPLNALKLALVIVTTAIFTSVFLIPLTQKIFMIYNAERFFVLIAIAIVIASIPIIPMLNSLTEKSLDKLKI